MTFKEKERQHSKLQQMTLSTNFNFNFATLKIFIKENKQLTQKQINKINR
jgi:hypothetical protein